MADHKQDEPKPDGAAFDNFFDSIGKKAEVLDKQDGKDPVAPVGAAPAPAEDDDEPKVVDEIESLCMNCRKNVRFALLTSGRNQSIANIYFSNRVPPGSY